MERDEIEQEVADTVHNVYLLDKRSIDAVDLYLYKLRNIRTHIESGNADKKMLFRYRRILNHANERWRFKHCNSRIFNQFFHKEKGIYPMIVELHQRLGNLAHNPDTFKPAASLKLVDSLEKSLIMFRGFVLRKAYK